MIDQAILKPLNSHRRLTFGAHGGSSVIKGSTTKLGTFVLRLNYESSKNAALNTFQIFYSITVNLFGLL
jgi:hypothetical protein